MRVGPRQGSVSWLHHILPIIQMLSLKSIPMYCLRENEMGIKLSPLLGTKPWCYFQLMPFFFLLPSQLFSTANFTLLILSMPHAPSLISPSAVTGTLWMLSFLYLVYWNNLFTRNSQSSFMVLCHELPKAQYQFFLCEYLMDIFSLFVPYL